ncbi:MAG: sigma-70 family RNA polymerase sigma factor [Deltaproteobacteria bacterium]|nr:sigma-70 family RNA polymerase sigma factor [Deltaproteobacteria bacterium]MCL5276385.1 sigma-70 family RNA polymerase sigma factor [Deltaproteobacteria bacterium]
MKKLNDPAVLERFKKGDVSAFDEIIAAYQDSIYGLCFHMLGDYHNAQDAAQDTFLKAYQSLKGFKQDASIYTWLYRIAVNTCIDYKRKFTFESLFKHHFNDERLIEQEPSDEPSPERISESRQSAATLKKALDKLSKKLKAVILLKEIEGLSYEEIAYTLDISIGTVKSRISRARDELRVLMEGTHRGGGSQ